MKTFFAVFFGIIAAAVVLFVAATSYLRFDRQTTARVKADALKRRDLVTAGLCSTFSPEFLREQNKILDDDLDTYAALLADAGDDPAQVEMARATLENQFRAKGCYPALELPKATPHAKKAARKARSPHPAE
jgi:hypothetical protein